MPTARPAVARPPACRAAHASVDVPAPEPDVVPLPPAPHPVPPAPEIPPEIKDPDQPEEHPPVRDPVPGGSASMLMSPLS